MRQTIITWLVALVFLLVVLPVTLRAQDQLVFPDATPLKVRLSPIEMKDGVLQENYFSEAHVFLQNNTDHSIRVEFVVQTMSVRGPIRFEVSTFDPANGKEWGEVPARAVSSIKLRIVTTNKALISSTTGLSSSGYLVATAVDSNYQGLPGIKPAVKPISFYGEPTALVGIKKFALPLGVSAAIVVLAGILLWLKNISPFASMNEVKFDPKESWLSNFVVGASILNGALGMGTLVDNVRTEVTLLAGLFALLILIGPITYSLTLRKSAAGESVSWVITFLVACWFTLSGGYGALTTAWLIFDNFGQTYLVSKTVRTILFGLILVIGALILVYAFQAIYRTVMSQTEKTKRTKVRAVRERSSLL